MIERIDSLRLENLKVCAILDIDKDRVNSLCLHMSLSQEEFRQVHRDGDDTRGDLGGWSLNRDLELGNENDNEGGDGNGNGNGNGNSIGNGNNGGNNDDGNENHNVNGRGYSPGA
ncbi:hypothetical protein Tco_0166036, partial [Tanacetum coccineum]